MMNRKAVMTCLRKTHDTHEMNTLGLKPVFIFDVYEKTSEGWVKLEDTFYADAPLEAIDQARGESRIDRKTFLKANYAGACNFFIANDGVRALMDLNTIGVIYSGSYFQKMQFPLKEEFIEKVIARREEMKRMRLL